MATVIVDWTKLRDSLSIGLSSQALANEVVSCIRSGRPANTTKFLKLSWEEETSLRSIILGARAAIASTRAGT